MLVSVGGCELESDCTAPSKHSLCWCTYEGLMPGSKSVSLQPINETFHVCCATIQKQSRRCLRPRGAGSIQRRISLRSALPSSRFVRGKPWRSRAGRLKGPWPSGSGEAKQTALSLTPFAATSCIHFVLAHVCQHVQACPDVLLVPSAPSCSLADFLTRLGSITKASANCMLQYCKD